MDPNSQRMADLPCRLKRRLDAPSATDSIVLDAVALCSQGSDDLGESECAVTCASEANISKTRSATNDNLTTCSIAPHSSQNSSRSFQALHLSLILCGCCVPSAACCRMESCRTRIQTTVFREEIPFTEKNVMRNTREMQGCARFLRLVHACTRFPLALGLFSFLRAA